MATARFNLYLYCRLPLAGHCEKDRRKEEKLHAKPHPLVTTLDNHSKLLPKSSYRLKKEAQFKKRGDLDFVDKFALAAA